LIVVFLISNLVILQLIVFSCDLSSFSRMFTLATETKNAEKINEC